MKPISDFIHNELYPHLFEAVDRAFPSMEFQRYRGGWASPYKLNGERSHDGRKEKSKVTEKYPHRVFEQGGESKDLISFYMELNSIPDTKEGLIEAVKQLSSLVGLTLPPMENEAEYRALREKQEKLEALDLRMREALFSDEGRGTLSYLMEKRGYSEEFIKKARFGFLSPSLREELRDTIYCIKEIGLTHFLSLPYLGQGNEVLGFVFRTTLQDEPKKYLDAFISEKASKKYHLFGLTGLRLTGNGERDRDITIVEGEIDALRATFAGLPNIVAASGGNVSAEALQEAKRRGVKRVTLLFDYDTPKAGQTMEEKQAEIDNKIERAISSIERAGLAPFVATFPSPDGGKVDADSYLQNHSKEELEEIISVATSGARWRAYKLLLSASDGKPKGEKELHELKRQTLELCTSRYTSPTDKFIILRELSEATNGYLSAEALQEEADLLKLAQDRNRQRQETIDLSAEALRLANNGQTAEALSLIQEKVSELQQISREAKYSELLRLPSKEEILRSFRERPIGLKTPYAFDGGDGREQLILPTGALTLIGAPTSHGKSRMLQNLALSLANDGEDGAILYFSFEEDSIAVNEWFVNINADMPLCQNNIRALAHYYTTGEERYFKGGKLPEGYKTKEAEYFSLLTSGKLRVFCEAPNATATIGLIRYLAKTIKVRAVFVDYIQKLNIEGNRLTRKDELKEICRSFEKLAIEASLPIILAAQLNRQTPSPVDMAVQNIADASEIEHYANIVMLMWNSVVKPLQGSTYYKSKENQTYSEEAKRLESRGFHIGEEGKLYVILAKNRYGARNIDAILDFNGNTGVIKSNYTQAEARPQPQQEPQQGELWDEPSDQVQSSF